MGKLEGKAAVVTGSGRGIGRAIALLLAEQGASVVVNDLGTGLGGDGQDESIAQQVVNEITGKGGKAVANTDSVSDYAGAGRMIQQAVDSFGRIDIVVNVAGILRDRMIFNMSEQEFDAVVAVHLDGTFNTSRHAATFWREHGGPGRIINFSSVSAWGSPGQPNYGAAKYGILGFTAVLANSLGRYNVTANAILPYATTRMIDSTPRGQQTLQETGKLPSELAEGTEGDPANVAPMVAYLATDDAAEINGHFFGVEGTRIQLYSHWELAGVLQADRRWTPEELAEHFESTIGQHLTPPEPVQYEGMRRPMRGAAAMQAAPDAKWQQLAPGIEVWERSAYYGPKG